MNLHSRLRHRHASAFTLTELLVVIVIIASLAALSITAVRQLRGAADKVVAVRNISQLHIANAGYAMDHAGKYVPVYAFDNESGMSSSWYNNTSFLGYLIGENGNASNSNNANAVSLGLLDPIVTRAKKNGYDSYCGSFGYNDEGFSGAGTGWGNPNATQSWLVSQVVSPERSCAFITCTDWIAKYSGRSLWKGAAAVEGWDYSGKIAYRHKGGKALVVYYDGHVGEITMKEIEQLDSHAASTMRGVKNIFWNADGK